MNAPYAAPAIPQPADLRPDLRPTPKTTLKIIALAAILAPFLAVLNGCSGSHASDTEQAYHHLAEVLTLSKQDAFIASRRLPGVILPSRNSELAFEVAGLITQINVNEGDRVVEGQVLASLDTTLLLAERDSLQAQMDDLVAGLDLNRKTMERIENLQGKNFAAQQRVDELTSERRQLQAGVSRINASLSANQTRIDKSSILAPFTGKVSRRYVDEGTVVDAGRPLLQMQEGGLMEARINVPARYVGKFSAGATLALESSSGLIEGQVLSVGTDVERPTLTVPVRISIPADSALPGDMVYALSDEHIPEAGFWVPVTALRDGVRGLWQVYALIETDDGNLRQIQSRDIQVRFLDEDRAYVTGALADGQVIVATGLHRLVPGQNVRVAEAHLTAGTN